MPSSEFMVVSALQRRRALARRATTVSVTPPVDAPHARPTRLTRDDCAVRNIVRYDRSNILAAIATCDPAPFIPGETDFDASAPHATPELIRGLSVVPNVPDPAVTDSTWERNFRIVNIGGNTHARDLGDRFAIRGVAACEGRMTFEGRTAETPTVHVRHTDGTAVTVPVSRFDAKESVHLRALHENARRNNAANNYRTGRELTMREALRAQAMRAAGGSQADYD